MNRKSTIAIILVLTMLLLPMSGYLNGAELPQVRPQTWATGNSVASEDTALNSSTPNSNHGNDSNLNLTYTSGMESNVVMTFPITPTGGPVPSGGSIESAILTLSLTFSQSQGDLYAYAAPLHAGFEEANATWMNNTHNTTWQSPGASGATDRGVWEPRSNAFSGTTASITINVTGMAQAALANNQSSMDLIISMLGTGIITIASSEHPTVAKRPKVTFTYGSSPPASGSTVTRSTPDNGTVPNTGALLLTADTTPTLSWTGLSGSGVEMQVSKSPDFRHIEDSTWLFSSWATSGFTASGANGSFTIPLASALELGMPAYWRVRASKTHQLSPWQTGHFFLPFINATDNGNNTGTFEIYRDSMNLSTAVIHDAWLKSGSPNTSNGTGANLWVGNSNNTAWGDMAILYGVDLNQTGLHTNATIHSAYLQLRRTDKLGDAWLSAHRLNNTTWSENGASWSNSSGNLAWAGSGLLQHAGPSLDVQNGNKSGPTFNFDVTYAVQDYLREMNQGIHNDAISFILKSSGANNEWARFAGSEEAAYTYRPKMVITYGWGDGLAPTDTVTTLSPEDGRGVWNVSNNNITANMAPVLNWSTTGHTNDDVRIEFAANSDFTEGPLFRVDSRDFNSGINKVNGTFTVPPSWGVDYGEDYYWRLRWVEAGDWGDYDASHGFFVSTMNSTYLANNTWELRLSHSNASATKAVPECQDTYLDNLGQTTNNDQSELSITSSQYTLFKCDLVAHTLPDGLAVTDAELRMRTSSASGTLTASVYEMLNHRWLEDEATWLKFNSGGNWSGAGASGAERGQLLDSTAISSSSTWVTWNVTTGVQNSMRWGVPADFLITGSGIGQAVMYDKENAPNINQYPELVIRYRSGSMAVPDPPQPTSPINGAWAVTTGMQIAPELRPTLTWNHTGSVSANGWVVEVDTSNTFNSLNLIVARSWVQINDFDVTNMTYRPASNLSSSQVWYWRVRGVSVSNQLGNWSGTADFVVPDIDSGLLDANNSYMVIRPGAAVASQGIPTVPDTWVAAGANRNSTHGGATNLVVGCDGSDCPKTAMLSFPLSELPQPSNSRIVNAELSLWAFSINVSITGDAPRISAHRTLRNWTDGANGVSWDGDMSNNSTTRWSQSGGIGSGDVGPMVDIASPTASSWFRLNVTEIVHDAITEGSSSVNISLRSDTNVYSEAMFYGADYTWQSSRPSLKVWYRNGSGSAASGTPTLTNPNNGNITWNLSGHELGSDQSPTMTWTHSNPGNIDHWRLFLYNDSNDERAGYQIFDSRLHAGFNLNAMSWTPSSSFSTDSQQRWFVQTIKNDLYGERSGSFSFDVPKALGSEINSTDARLRVIEGGALTRLSLPQAFADTTLDSFNSNSNYGSNQGLYVGRSQSSSSYDSWTVMRVNISTLPIPNPWQVISATIEMYCTSCSAAAMTTSVHQLNSDFVESQATHNRHNSTTAWPTNSVGGVLDTVTVYGSGWYGWNVTQLMQAARSRGDDTILLAFTGSSSGNNAIKQFHSSEYTFDSDLRPVLNITHRVGNQWIPADASNLVPANPSTLWQAGESRPSGRNPVSLMWSHPAPSNVTSWQIQLSSDAQFTPTATTILDSSSGMTYSGTWGTNPLSYTIAANDLPPGWAGWPDAWAYWRVRPIIGDSLGNWTTGGEFRVPADQGFDDGLGNHTVKMFRGSVFTNSGLLPTVPDTWVDSTPGAGTTTSQGSNSTIVVGDSPFQAGHQSVGLVQFDLSELPFPPNMLATTVSLKMYRVGYSTTGSATVGVHQCSSFQESATWSSYNISNNCNSTAATTLAQSVGGFGGVWYDWDVTNIVRNAGYNGTVSIAVKVTNYTGYLQFASSETSNSQYKPQLQIGYVDNQNGTLPPATPTLNWPTDQQVIYSVSQYDDFLLEPSVRPTLNWRHTGDSTGYVLRMWNATDTNIFYSWNASAGQGVFSNTSTLANFTPGWDLEVGGVYYWNVQGINVSILGPRSSTWAFGIGNADTSALGNNIWTTTYQEGADVSEFNHPLVEDTYISEGNPSTNYVADALKIGEGCTGGPSSSELCIGIINVDLSQIPLTADGRAHSGRLALYLASTSAPTSTWLDITAYALLNPNYLESQATWQQASLGNNWATAGIGAGTDRDVLALDTVRLTATSQPGWYYFDVSGALVANLNGTFSIVLVPLAQPTPPMTAQFTATFRSSEYTNASHRPTLDLNYTSVFDISVTGATTTTADNQVQMSATLLDVDNSTVAGTVEWSTTDGTIDASGLFTPDHSGNVTISARFGRVIVTHLIIVQPGTPTLLVGGPSVSTITSDESVSMWFDVLDVNGNSVPGVTLSFAVTNGSVAQGVSHTTPISPLTYMPWQTGAQWVNVTWSGGSLSLQVTVTEGLPDYLVMTGYPSIPAGETRDFNWTAYDAHDNPVTPIRLLSVNWTVENGNITQIGEYTADKVGFWNVTLTTGYGLNITQNVETTYGAIQDLLVIPSASSLTADEQISIWTTRIDVRGNIQNVTLPSTAWVVSNGTLVGGEPVVWQPWTAATQTIDATLEGVTTRIVVSVIHGEAVGISLSTQDGETLTSGDTATVYASNFDQYGNDWQAAIDGWEIDEAMADQNWLVPSSSLTEFEAVTVGSWTITATYMHDDDTVMRDSISFEVIAGPLASILIDGHGSQLTADESLTLNPVTRDQNQNMLPTDQLRWFIWDSTSPTQQPPACLNWGNEMTESIQASGHIWDATTEGTWRICAFFGSYQAIVEVTVSHGQAAILYQAPSGDTLVAGASISNSITAADSDGNIFALDVTWSGSPASDFTDEDDVGVYSWHGTTVGNYSLVFTHGETALSGTWDVSVTPSVLETLEMTVSPGLSVRQQETITIDVRAFDAFGNEIEVPESAVVHHRGELHQINKVSNSQWTIYLVDAGETEITVVAQEKFDSEKVMVEGTLLGFFEEGGTLYYIGAGLGLLLLIGMVITLVVLLRRIGGEDDDEDDDYYEDDYDDGPFTDPQHDGGDHQYDDEYHDSEQDSEAEITVDEEGTEWWEDEQGVWWYRSGDMDDWEVWEE